MKKFKSCAEWPKELAVANNISTDNHDTESQAKAVCRMLERDGFGGNGEIFPIRTWVEPIKE